MHFLVAALLLSATSFVHAQTVQTAQNQGAIDAAKMAAEEWLGLVDAGQYKASWEQASELLRKSVSAAQWEKAGRAARLPVGAFQGRTLASSNYATTLPGVPPGQYVVLQYTTRFADRASAIETVTPMLEADGTWRVSGYYIK